MMTVWCTTEFITHHRYLSAPNSVKFLRDFHRHIFKVKVAVEVKHNNRDIEFIMLKRSIATFCKTTWPEFNDNDTLHLCEDSCEVMCETIKDAFKHLSLVEITVSEDGENGSTWYRD